MRIVIGMFSFASPRSDMRPVAHLCAVVALCLVATAQLALGQASQTEVMFPGTNGFELKGTLVIPSTEGDKDGEGARPAILLLPGSGPTDRDGNQHPLLVTNLLKQVADALAAEGVATLRFDKRAVRHYAAHWPRQPEELDAFFEWDSFVGDARAALEYLRQHPEVDPKRTAIAGHSEGGLIALQLGRDLAGSDARPVGLILLAAAGRTLDVVVREQVAASLERGGADDEQARSFLDHTDAAIEAVKNREPLPPDLPRELVPLFNPTVLRLLHAYFTIDPGDLARAFPGDVLIVHGEKDIQVSAADDAMRLEQALQERTAGSVRMVIVPGASHNLKDLDGDPHGFRGPIVEEALAAIIEWVQAHLKAQSPIDSPAPE